ncbi:quinoprotein [Stigmatella sp. ncwal1]|uniref:Quinoprotein n=1 Tax=Stigmatella ashevillensis TaxID=2995309 RepID=A0ABT5DE94_9BACT|nr:ELWxxDGT repeat protein [Stigmatella ashevillena]MDC0712000.1 quinoprotein [Stigmatella ashevillena]
MSTPVLLADLSPSATGSLPRELVAGNGILFFTADDGAHGRELWKSHGFGDATGPGAFLVKDLRPGASTSNPRRLTMAGSQLFFTADDGVHGRELWVSDGTPAGTRMVKDIWPGAYGASPDQLLAFGPLVYFAANDGQNGIELWRSDGTETGTFLVSDLYPGDDVYSPGAPGSSSPRRLTRVGDALFFVANVNDEVFIWRSLGLSSATSVFSGPEDNFLSAFTAADSKLFFLHDNDEGEASLWCSHGTVSEQLRFFPGLYPHDLTALGGKIFFSAGGGEPEFWGEPEGEELWVSDGTSHGTFRVKDIWPGPDSSAPSAIKALEGKLYFAASDALHGRELWSSDGTAKGTLLLSDLAPGPWDSAPENLTPAAGLLFFSADTPGRGREPWVSNGTEVGTMALQEIAPGNEASDPQGFVRLGWDVFFTAQHPLHGTEIWGVTVRPGVRCDVHDDQ